jgi:hypothetical protein
MEQRTITKYINVDWRWLIFPHALLALSFIFLVATIVKSRLSSIEIWEASTLAMIQILKEDTRMELGPLRSTSEMKKIAGSKQVRMTNEAGAWSI